MDAADKLLAFAVKRMPEEASAWFARRVEGLASASPDQIASVFTSVARRVGLGGLDLDAGDEEGLRAHGITWPISRWDRGGLARVAWLALAQSRCSRAADWVEVTSRLYEDGDNRERQAVLRALPFFDLQEEHLPLAIDATRTHVTPIFEAIACENPFPADHFPDLNFCQMVLKAAFLGVHLRRIEGLHSRRTPELARMARDYAEERRTAGRSVPEDLGILGMDPRDGSAEHESA